MEDKTNKVEADFDSVIVLKNLVIEQITRSKDVDYHYKLRLDFIHNYREKNYVDMMSRRTDMSAVDLYKNATTFIAKANSWIYKTISEMTEEERAQLANDTSVMDDFIAKVHKELETDNDVFLQKGH